MKKLYYVGYGILIIPATAFAGFWFYIILISVVGVSGMIALGVTTILGIDRWFAGFVDQMAIYCPTEKTTLIVCYVLALIFCSVGLMRKANKKAHGDNSTFADEFAH